MSDTKKPAGKADATPKVDEAAKKLEQDLAKARGGQLRVIPAETVARMRIELALADFDSLSPESLAQIRRNLGSDLVVAGSYLALGPGGGGRVRAAVHPARHRRARTRNRRSLIFHQCARS